MTVEEAFHLTFQVGITDAMGSRITFDLKENGETIPVTNTNREVIFFNKFLKKKFFCL